MDKFIFNWRLPKIIFTNKNKVLASDELLNWKIDWLKSWVSEVSSIISFYITIHSVSSQQKIEITLNRNIEFSGGIFLNVKQYFFLNLGCRNFVDQMNFVRPLSMISKAYYNLFIYLRNNWGLIKVTSEFLYASKDYFIITNHDILYYSKIIR